jgi:hypothetical protein
VVPVTSAALNLNFFLHQRCSYNRLAEIIGFPSGTTLFTQEALAPRHWNFEHPTYLLVELGLAHMSALISHRCGSDVKSNLMAKVLVSPQIRLERGYPMSKSGSGVSYITQLKVSIYNPWHSLYNFHGRDFSLTLVLGSAQRMLQLECP